MMNLLSNSIDAVKDQSEKWIEVDYQFNEEWFDIFMKDSGPGVPEEIRSKIMEHFFTTKDINQGTGLGLSISKNIIETHGGDANKGETPQEQPTSEPEETATPDPTTTPNLDGGASNNVDDLEAAC